MSILTELAEGALEPEYRTTTAPRRSPVRFAVAVTLATALIVVAMLATLRSDVADERSDLATRAKEAEERRDSLSQEVATLDAEIRLLQRSQIQDSGVAADVFALEAQIGGAEVTGPGLVITANDAPSGSGNGKGVIFDSDLSRLINGLWEAGAEAIAINGHRVSTLTPIRSAGSAITVDYVSISPPYQIEAIGDPSVLPSRLARTQAGSWWQYIHDNYGIGFEVFASTKDLQLPGDPGMTLRKAES